MKQILTFRRVDGPFANDFWKVRNVRDPGAGHLGTFNDDHSGDFEGAKAFGNIGGITGGALGDHFGNLEGVTVFW